MPTGYTAAVADGQITELAPFAMHCARAFGALISMRDASPDAAIPEKLEPAYYYAERLAEVQRQLAALRALSPSEWQAAADEELAGRQAAADEALEERDLQRARYDAMIEKVEAWEGAPEGIKPFMLDQLRTGRDADCPAQFRWYQSLEPMSGEDWKRQREEQLLRESAQAAKSHQEEIDRVAGRNAWLTQLRASLRAHETGEAA